VSADRLYRALLLAYPRGYREARGEELLATLLDADDDARGRGRWAEVAALVRHGVAQRAHLATGPVRGSGPALGLAGVALAVVLAVLGLHQLLAAVPRATGLHGFPEEWQVYVQWVDPRWPVHAAWLVGGLALLAGRAGVAVVTAWSTVLLHGWYLVAAAASGGQVPWVGNVGPFWFAPSGTAELGWFMLSLATAVLLGTPGRTRHALAGGQPDLRRTALLGVAVTFASTAAGPALRAIGSGVPGSPYRVEGPMAALLVTAALLAWSLRQTRDGRVALLVLVVLASAPLGVRWTQSWSTVASAALVFTTGYLVASVRRRGVPPPPAQES
jgi:hypothetical protein